MGDHVAHLVGGAEVSAELVSRGLQGHASPPEGYPAPTARTAASRAEGIAQRAISLRESLAGQLLPTFNATNDRLNQLLAGLGPQDWGKPCFYPAGTRPVRAFVDLRLTEMTIHWWDIRSNLEPSAHLSPASLPVFIDVIPGLVGWIFRAGSRLPAPVLYRFEVTGAVAIPNDIVVEGDGCRMEPPGEAEADVIFRCGPETLVLLMYGRLPLDVAVAEGRLAVEGDEGLATQFGRWFQGI